MKKSSIKLSLKQSLILLVAIPFIGLLSSLIIQVRSDNEDLNVISNQVLNADFIYNNANLISSIQKERGLSATLINGGDTKTKVQAMRNNVDKLYSEVKSKFEKVLFYEKEKQSFLHIESTIKRMRTSVNNKSIKFTAVMEGYSDIVKILIDLNYKAKKEKTTGGIGKHFVSINTLIDAQEGAGRFRGYTSSILTANKKIAEKTMNTLLFDFNIMVINIKSKEIILTDQSSKIRDEFLKSPELARTTRVFLTVNREFETGEYNLDSQVLWDDATKLISYIETIIKYEFIVIANTDKKLKNHIESELRTITILTILTAVLIFIVSIVVIRYITSRISKVTNRLEEMSAGGGDLTNLLDSDIDDDLGKLSNSFNSYILSLASLISGIKKLGINFVSFSMKLKKLTIDINRSKTIVSESLHDVSENIIQERTRVLSMKLEMDSVESSSTTLSRAVEEQVTAVEQSSAAVEQMIANIRTVTGNVERTANIVSDLSISGVKGKEQVKKVTSEINNVSELSNSLKNANNLIADIASQTSLLSMNAAIEAAHAGDAGKGFAVVADEIRKLSESTASQSKGIKENLDLIIKAIFQAVTSSKETELTFTEITDKIELVSQNQEQIKNAMLEQNQGSSEILEAITLLNSNSSSVDSAVSDLNIAGEKMKNEEEEVHNIIINVENSVKEMDRAVSNIEKLLNTLTEEEHENNKLVSDLSKSMDVFTVN